MKRLTASTMATLCFSLWLQGQDIIRTIAGGGPNNVPALDAPVGQIPSIAVGPFGDLYVATWNLDLVLKVDPTGTVTIAAGVGREGYSGDGGPATSAQLATPLAVAVDHIGNLYIADHGNARIRKVDLSGTITTVVGNGIRGFGGDNGPATSASIDIVRGMTFDAAGNLYFADSGTQRIRKVDTSGTIATVAGNGIQSCCGDGGPATNAYLRTPYDVAVDGDGNLYIADTDNRRVRKVDTAGIITTFAGTGASEPLNDGGPATLAAFERPYAVATDAAGNVYVADHFHNRVRKIDENGSITTVAGNGVTGFGGDGGPAVSAAVGRPLSLAIDNAGALFVSMSSSRYVRKVSPSGIIETVAGTGTLALMEDGHPATDTLLHFPGLGALDPSGRLHIIDGFHNRIRRINSDGTLETVASTPYPAGLAFDSQGNMYVSEINTHRVQQVDPNGNVTTVAGNGTSGFSGDGGPAILATLQRPQGLAVDRFGNLYIADSENDRIRMVDPGGTISTVAGNGVRAFSGDGGPASNASFSRPSDVAIDDVGNIFVADRENYRIRRIDLLGIVTTVAGNGDFGFSDDGGLATTVSLANPQWIAADPFGNFYISDGNSFRVRKVDSQGTISSVAGNGTFGFSGDGGPATSAQLSNPGGIVVDDAGNLYIGDGGNHRIRMVDVEDQDGDGVPDADDLCPTEPLVQGTLSYLGELIQSVDTTGFASVIVQAELLDSSHLPIEDQEVAFSLEGSLTGAVASCSGWTDPTGLATCDVTGLPPDVYSASVLSEPVLGCVAAAHEDALIVVFDADQPHATGGGFILPDEESTQPAESAQDKASFGFVVRINDESEADGNLEFQYKTGNINLRSQAMSWYTVSNNKAMFQGEATVNGAGSYTFRVHATDGAGMNQADHFDIRIWAGSDTESEPIHRSKNDLAAGNIVVQRR